MDLINDDFFLDRLPRFALLRYVPRTDCARLEARVVKSFAPRLGRALLTVPLSDCGLVWGGKEKLGIDAKTGAVGFMTNSSFLEVRRPMQKGGGAGGRATTRSRLQKVNIGEPWKTGGDAPNTTAVGTKSESETKDVEAEDVEEFQNVKNKKSAKGKGVSSRKKKIEIVEHIVGVGTTRETAFAAQTEKQSRKGAKPAGSKKRQAKLIVDEEDDLLKDED
eukprot:g3537.t1